MPAQKSAKPPKTAPDTAAKAVSKTAAKAPAKAAPKKAAAVAEAADAKKVKNVPVKSTAELIKAADELLKKKPARAKAAAAATDDEEAPKKKPGRPAKAAAAGGEAKAPAKRGRKPKAAAASDDVGDDADLSDIEADLEGEVEESTEAAATVEKVKPLRMKISKAKERALMKEFGLDETVLSEEDLQKRRSRLKTLIKLGKTRGYLTHVEINDHLPDKLVDAETLEAVITTLNDLGVAVYEQTPDAEALIITDNAPAGATEEEAEEAAEAALSTVDSEFGRTTDPVRMYMREMGTVELLTREGEIEIAKRIEGGLMAMMEAHYYINSQDPVALRRGVELLDKSLASQPDQPLLLAERYLAGEALATLTGTPQSERLQGIGAHLASVVRDQAALPARVWEALTLQAILNGQQQEATRLLAEAASRGRSVLYHILRGKLAELDGRPEAAGDAYSQAFLMEATEQTYLLCQQLGFYSNMETLTPALFNALGQSKVKLF